VARSSRCSAGRRRGLSWRRRSNRFMRPDLSKWDGQCHDRCQEALAEKDRELAELRDNWLKAHEAFWLSQEALAQKDAQLAQKDLELARLRAIHERRVAPAQRDAQLAEFRDNLIKAHEALQHSRELLAQRDAQLTHLRAESSALSKAFRLGQEL